MDSKLPVKSAPEHLNLISVPNAATHCRKPWRCWRRRLKHDAHGEYADRPRHPGFTPVLPRSPARLQTTPTTRRLRQTFNPNHCVPLALRAPLSGSSKKAIHMIGIRDSLRYAAPGTLEGLSAPLVSRVTVDLLRISLQTGQFPLANRQASSRQTTPAAPQLEARGLETRKIRGLEPVRAHSTSHHPPGFLDAQRKVHNLSDHASTVVLGPLTRCQE